MATSSKEKSKLVGNKNRNHTCATFVITRQFFWGLGVLLAANQNFLKK